MGFPNPLTIVMYHYVRPIADSAYPGIKGLELADFEGQLDYLQRHYRIVSPAEVAGCLKGDAPLPARALMLTFDDGYRDHIRHAFPSLRRRGLPAAFFAPMEAIVHRKMLDVNRIHYVLAATADRDALGLEIETMIEDARGEFELGTVAAYRSELRKPYFFDDAATGYVKRLLQHALPERLRGRIAERLFASHVSADERAFADDLYMDARDLRELAGAGMEVGGHGHRHYWLGRLDAAGQAEDVGACLAALEASGLAKPDFWFCYPYGSYDPHTLRILRERGCAGAVTTDFGIAECIPGNALELKRLDTNDLPRSGGAPVADWTRKILEGALSAPAEAA